MSEATSCFLPADILLPCGADWEKWAVIACDQYTSQPEYWEKAAALAGSGLSALNLVYPEVYLGEGGARTERICAAMRDYLDRGVLLEAVRGGYILVERETEHGTRLGLIGVIDLEAYDFTPGARARIRATEGTVLSRIPPRVRIRENAALECPHVMLLLDDAKSELIEPIAARSAELRKLYDFDLMLDGGHVRGYAVEGEMAAEVSRMIRAMEAERGDFFLAAGDGNHSLATAKTCWENIKAKLSADEAKRHPARYTLVEVVNLHDESLVFEPIHRIVCGAELNSLTAEFRSYLELEGMAAASSGDVVFFDARGGREALSICGLNGRLPVDVLQRFLDGFIARNPAFSIDYIHGAESVAELVRDRGAVGILLNSIDKHALFPAIAAGGALPRKTFSIGEADEKRFYIECRRIEVR